MQRVGGVPLTEAVLESGQFVKELLKPQFVHLVHDDEKQLVVLVGPRALGR